MQKKSGKWCKTLKKGTTCKPFHSPENFSPWTTGRADIGTLQSHIPNTVYHHSKQQCNSSPNIIQSHWLHNSQENDTLPDTAIMLGYTTNAVKDRLTVCKYKAVFVETLYVVGILNHRGLDSNEIWTFSFFGKDDEEDYMECGPGYLLVVGMQRSHAPSPPVAWS